MGLTTGSLFSLAERRLAWVDQRQQLLAENIANADTPGYAPRDLAPFSAALDDAAGVVPLRSSARDLPPIPVAAQISATPTADTSVYADLGKLADTEGMQSFVINLYGAYLGMFRSALDIASGSGS